MKAGFSWVSSPINTPFILIVTRVKHGGPDPSLFLIMKAAGQVFPNIPVSEGSMPHHQEPVGWSAISAILHS